MFFNFLNFFAIFFGILKLRSGKNGSERGKQFPTFSVLPDPFMLKIKPGLCFLVFWIFLGIV